MMFSPSSNFGGTERKRPAAMSERISRATSISMPLSSNGTVKETRTVSPMPCETSCSNATRVLITPSGGMPASVTPRCSGTSGRSAGELLVDLNDLFPVGVFERDDVTIESEVIEQPAVLGGRGDDRRDMVVWVALQHARIDRPAVYADPDGAVVVAAAVSAMNATLSLTDFDFLVMVQMAWVVANLVHMRRDLRAEPVVLLQVDRERRFGLFTNGGERFDVLA